MMLLWEQWLLSALSSDRIRSDQRLVSLPVFDGPGWTVYLTTLLVLCRVQFVMQLNSLLWILYIFVGEGVAGNPEGVGVEVC